MTSLTYLASLQIAQPRAMRGGAQGMSITTMQRRTSASRARGSCLPPDDWRPWRAQVLSGTLGSALCAF